MTKSLEFAKKPVPDFIIMKEAIIVFEKLIIDAQSKHNAEDDQIFKNEWKDYLMAMI